MFGKQKLNSKIAYQHTGRTIFAVILVCAYVIAMGLFTGQVQPAQAAIPKYINFQGKLTQVSDGSNMANGNYAFEFKIYDALTSGTLLWTETFDQPSGACGKLAVTNGVFNAKLGSCNALTSVDFTGGSLFMTVNFAPTGTSYDGEMAPRKQLVSSAYAFVANGVSGDGAVNTTNSSTTAITAANLGSGYAFQVDASTASADTGLKVTSADAASGLALAVISSGTNEALTINSKGSGDISLGSSSTGNINIGSSGTGNILLGGGSGSTGCTVTNSTGALACTASVTAPYIYGGDMTTTYGGYQGGIFGGTASHAVLDFVDNGTRIGEFYTTSSSFNFYTNAGSNLNFYTNNDLSTAVIAASSGGAVGIRNNSPTALLTLGTAGSYAGTMSMAGSSSGVITIQPQAAAGTYNFNLPTAAGTSGYVLTSAGGGASPMTWTDPSGLGVRWNAIAAPTGNTSLAHAGNTTDFSFNSVTTGTAFSLNSTSLTSGKILDISSNGTAAGASQTGLNVSLQGTNGTSAITSYGAQISNAHAGTTSSNVGLSVSATNGTTGNYALIVPSGGGNVGIGTSTPNNLLTLGNATFTANGDGVIQLGTTSTTVTAAGNLQALIKARTTVNISSVNNFAGIDVVPTVNSSSSITTVRGGLMGAVFNPATATTLTNADGINWTVAFGATAAGAITNSHIVNVNSPIQQGTVYPTNMYGIQVNNQGLAGMTNAYGLYVDAQSGATNNYSAIFAGGNVGIGTATPSALLSVGSSSQFQVNSSGAIAAAAGITSSGTITFSGLGGGGTQCVNVNNSGVLGTTGCASAYSTWTSDTDADGYDLKDLSNVEFRDTTGAPAGSVVAIFSDNTGDLNINSLTGKTTNIQVNGTDEYNFSSTTLAMNSNTITNAGTINGLQITANTGVITTGTWNGTAVVDTYVADTLTVDSSSSVHWNALNNYPAACSAGSAISQLADTTNTCTAFNTDTSITLQDAYDATSGNTITTTTARNIAIVLAEVATPTSLTIENQDTAATSAQRIFNSIASGTATNGLLIEQTGAGTMTNAIQIAETAGTITDGILITGTLSNILNSSSIDITGAGAITGATGITSATGDITATAGNVAITAGALTLGGTTRISNAGVGTFITGTVIGSQTFTTNNIADSGALTIASGTASALTLNSGTTGTINIGTDASAETINIGNTGAAVKTIAIGNNSQANTITIGDASATGVSITDNNWSISAAGAASFTTGAFTGAVTGATSYNGLVITANTGVITTGTWNGTAVGAQYGGTGINSSASTGVPSISSGTWSVNAQLPLSLGGTNAALTASNGGIVYSTGSAMAILAGTATAGQMLRSGSSGAPSWSTATFPSTATSAGTILRADGTNWVASTATYPNTTTINQILYSSAGNTVSGITTANYGLLNTSSGGVPSITATPVISGSLTIGVAGTGTGALNLAGTTSGTISILPQAAAGTYNFNLPTTAGTSGHVLTSAGGGASAMTWTDPSGLGVRWNAIAAPTGNLSLAHGANTTDFSFNSFTTGTAFSLNSTSVTTGKILDISSNGTAAGASQTGLNVSLQGTNATSAITSYGVQISNAHAGTTSTNVGLQLSATNGTTANYALIVPSGGGNVGIGTSAPVSVLDVVGAAQFSNTVVIKGTAGSGLFFGDASTYGQYSGVYGSNGGNDINIKGYASSTIHLGFGNSTGQDLTAKEAVTIKSTGLVGINNTSPSALLTLGTAGTTAGTLSMAGSTSGTITIQPQAAAGTYNFNLPTTAGNSGEILTSAGGAGSPMTWTAPGALAVRWSSLIAPTGNLSIAHGANTTDFSFNSLTTGTAFSLNSTSLSSGAILNLSSNGTAGLTNQTGLNIALQGTNGTSAQTTYGAQVSNAHAGTTSTNVALQLSATNGTTANYALIVPSGAGSVGIGTSTPSEKLEIGSGGNISLTSGYLYQKANGRTRYYNSANSNYSEIYNPSAGGGSELYIIDGTGTGIRLDGSGNVGINTTGPDRKLDVLDASNPQLRLTQADGTVYSDLQTDSSGYLNMTATGHRVRVVDNYNGANSLYVLNSTTGTSASENLVLGQSTAGDQIFQFGYANTTNSIYGSDIGVLTTGTGATGGILMATQANAPIAFSTNGLTNPRLTILGGGNVGVGDATPASLFTVGTGDLFQVASTGQTAIFADPISADYAFSIDGTTGNDNSRLINLTQANNATESSYGVHLTNTPNAGTLNTSNRTIAGWYQNLNPTFINGTSSGTTTASIYGTLNDISSSNFSFTSSVGTSTINNIYGNAVNLSGTPTITDVSTTGANFLNEYGTYNNITTVPTWSGATDTLVYDSYGGYFNNAANTAGNALLTSTVTGVYGAATGNLTTTGTTAHYGGRFIAGGTATTNTALYATASGGTYNYAAIFEQGYVGINTLDPEAPLHVYVAGGTAAIFGASSAGAQISIGMDFINASNGGTPSALGINTTGGNVGIGTIAPGKALEINHATGQNLRLTYNDADGSATNYADLLTTSGGNLTIVPSGGTASITGIATISSILQVGSATATTYSRLGTGTTGHAMNAADDLLISDDLEVDGDAWFDGNITIAGTCTGCGGGATAWDLIADPSGNGAINMGTTVQTLDWGATTTTDNLSVTSSATGLTSGSAFKVTSATTGAVTNGIVQLLGSAAFTGAGGLLNVTANSTATGTIAKFSGTGLTSGTGINVTGSGATMQTGGELIDLVLGANTVGAGLTVTSTGTYTGVGAADGLINVTANGLTSGYGMQIAHTTSVISTTGSLMRLSSTSADTGTAGTLLSLQSSGSTAGTIAMITNNTASFTGISQSISNTGITSGTGLLITGGSSLTTNGELIDLNMSTSAGGQGINITNTGTYTGTGLILMTANSATTGTVLGQSATALTTGRAISTTLGTALTTGGLLSTTGASYLHTGTETGSLISLAYTDASSNASGTAITNGILLSPTINTTASAGSKTINGLNITPTYTACGTTAGTCAYNGITQSTAAVTQSTTNALTIIGSNLATAGALVQNTAAGSITWVGQNIQMPNITQTTGTVTSTGIKITGGTVTSGTSYALITSSSAGNVGIGIATPTNLLDVNGTAGFGFENLEHNGGFESGSFIAPYFDVADGGAGVLTVTSGGGWEGSYFIRNSAQAGSHSFRLRPNFTVPTTKASFSVWARNNSVSNSWGSNPNNGLVTPVTMYVYDETAAAVACTSSLVSPSTTWTRISVSCSVTAGNTFSIQVQPDGWSGQYNVDFDGFQAQAGLAVTEFGSPLKLTSSGGGYINGNVALSGALTLQNASPITTAYGGFGSYQNHLVRSEAFDNASWTKTNVTTPTADTQVAPDGSTTAESLATSSSGGDVCQFTGTAPGSNTFTFTVWAKSSTGNQNFDLRVDAGATSCATANSTTGTASTFTATTSWQRFSVTQAFSGASNFVKARIFPGGTGGSGTIYAWGAQLDMATTAGTYAKTTSSALTNDSSRGMIINTNLKNTTASGFLYGARNVNIIDSTTAGTHVGQFIRMADNTSLDTGQVVRGLEVQAFSGSNVNGTNTGIATYGYTFGIQATTTSQAAAQASPAAVFADLDNGTDSTTKTRGNAIRAYTNDATSATLVQFYQETSAYTGTGLQMDFGNNSGSYIGNYVDLMYQGTSKYNIGYSSSTGKTTATWSATGSTVDYASATNGNTFIWKIPQKATSGTCASAGAEGVIFQNTGGTQVGHMCIDGPSSGTPNKLRFYAEQFNGTATDVAENYSDANDSLEAGDVVMMDTTSGVKYGVTKSTGAYNGSIMGVISTAPGVLLSGINEDDRRTDLVNPKPVALSGRVPVKVSNENGYIEPGDFLTASSTPGVAMKATKAGPVIGQALKSFSGGVGKIDAFIKATNFNGVAVEKEMPGIEFNFIDEQLFAETTTDILENLLAQLPNLDPSNLSEVNTDVVIASGAVITPNVITSALRADSLSSATAEGGLEVASTTIFNGGLQVDSISSIGDLLSFEGDVEFFGTPYFTTDTAGFAVVKAGVQSVDITFTREYLAQPIVNASLSFEQDADLSSITDQQVLDAMKAAQIAQAQAYLNEDISFVVTNKSKYGFTIVMSKPATTDVKFSWTALAVRNATTFMSLEAPTIPDNSGQQGDVAGDSTGDNSGDGSSGSGSGDSTGGETPPVDGSGSGNAGGTGGSADGGDSGQPTS